MARHRVIRKTKVIATIGPACDSLATIEAMIRAGMNVARLNFSHGSHAEHRKRLENVREAANQQSANVAIMLDTRGVEIRTGRIKGGSAHLTTGEPFTLYTDGERMGDATGVSISLAEVPETLTPRSAILLDDGVIELRVREVGEHEIQCQITRGGRLEDRKGVNLPDTAFARRAISPDDHDDLRFAADHGIEYIAASFVRSGDDVLMIRRVLEEFGVQIPIIAKIENDEGFRNLEEIVATADGTMVARGDLGVEMPLRQVPLVQKKIIRTTVTNGKPVITATQMLDSMERNPVPTRAEVSDVANAILDGTSAVMLSGETAVGAYPVEAVRTMAALALEAEGSLREYGQLQHILPAPAHVVTEAVTQAAITMADHLEAAVLITLTETGFTSRSISKFRPECPILAVTGSPEVVRKLAMNWGVTAMLFEGKRSDEAMIEFAMQRARELGYVRSGDVAVVTAGTGGVTGSTDAIRVVTVDD